MMNIYSNVIDQMLDSLSPWTWSHAIKGRLCLTKLHAISPLQLWLENDFVFAIILYSGFTLVMTLYSHLLVINK